MRDTITLVLNTVGVRVQALEPHKDYILRIHRIALWNDGDTRVHASICEFALEQPEPVIPEAAPEPNTAA